MADYKLTIKGKIVLTVFILILIIGWVYSGLYILDYFIDHTVDELSSTTEEGSSEYSSSENTTVEGTSKALTLETTKDSIDGSTEESTEESTGDKQEGDDSQSNIYSVYDLEDLKLFKIIIYYDNELTKLVLSSEDQQSIFEMLASYPNEVIAVSGYINGYPNFNNSDKLKLESLEMAKNVKKILVQNGLETTKINVYGYGTDYPISKDYGNQDKNNRVEIYFENHYVIGSQSK